MLDDHLKFPNALPKGYKLEHYHIIQTLAEDNLSLTYLASTAEQEIIIIVEYLPKHLALRDKTNNHVILKGPNCKYDYEWGLSHYQQEINDLTHIEHSNINNIQAVVKANNTLYKISPYISGRTLKTYAQNRTLTEEEIITLLDSLLAGLNTIHQAGYLHGDLTPYNIIIEDDTKRLVIMNLGTTKHLFLGHKNSPQPLSTNYAAYEQYHDTEKQGVWTDIYAVGTIFYEVITSITPTASIERLNTTLQQHVKDPIAPARLITNNNYSERLLTAIDHAIQLPITARPHSIKEWEEELNISHQVHSKQESNTPTIEPLIEKTLTISGLSTTSDENPSYMDFDTISQPMSISKKIGSHNKRYAVILLLIALIAIITVGAFYYMQVLNQPDKQYKDDISTLSLNQNTLGRCYLPMRNFLCGKLQHTHLSPIMPSTTTLHNIG